MVAQHRGRRCARIARRDGREYRAIFEGGATMRGAMQRRPNAGTISPRTARGAGSRRSLPVMPHRISCRFLALAVVLALAAPALAQTGLVKGKVVDAGKPVADAAVTIEFMEGVSRKLTTKSDRRGEFVQLGLQSGGYRVSATADKLGSGFADVRVRIGQTVDVTITLSTGAGRHRSEDGGAEEGVRRRRRRQPRQRPRHRHRPVPGSVGGAASLPRVLLQHRLRVPAEEGREAGRGAAGRRPSSTRPITPRR